MCDNVKILVNDCTLDSNQCQATVKLGPFLKTINFKEGSKVKAASKSPTGAILTNLNTIKITSISGSNGVGIQ